MMVQAYIWNIKKREGVPQEEISAVFIDME
jgi:hypothetical protein